MPDLIVHASDGVAYWGGQRVRCAVGRGGAGEKRREGDGVTPLGRFRLLHMFWRPDRVPRPALDAIPGSTIRPGDGWSDAPEDPHYNRLIRRPRSLGHERMWRADGLYDLCAVMDWNIQPVTAGAGSAIFLHCAAPDWRPTEGCVALAAAELGRVLKDWTEKSRVVVAA